MAAIIIKDLISGKELDQRAMASIRGGFYYVSGPTTSDQSQSMTGTPTTNPSAFGPGPDSLQLNSSPNQNPYSFRDLARKHTYLS
jgi:hypothetical protein